MTWIDPRATDRPYLTQLKWNARDRFAIERVMIQRGGTYHGLGEGLAYHYKAAISALWPSFWWHRWSHLLIEKFAEGSEVAVQGPASSGKTFCAAAFGLCTFWVWPTGTSVIMSSTTKEGLQLRIWGAIKELYNKGRQTRPHLPGRLIESRYMLTGANISEDEDAAQDFRDGIIGVACFLPGTMVDTPGGEVPIERIRVGDSVLNAFGVGKVKATHTRTAQRILRVTISDGRTVDCTDEHPFFTQRGWVKAVDLTIFDMVFSAHEAVRIMRGEFGWPVPESEVLLGAMPRLSSSSEVRGVRSRVHAHETPWEEGSMERALLFEDLCRAMGRASIIRFGSSENIEVQALRKGYAECSPEPEILLRGMPKLPAGDAVQALRQSVHRDQGIPIEASQYILQSILQAECDAEAQAPNRIGTHHRGTDSLEDVSECNLEPSFEKRNQQEERDSELVQVGRGISGDSTRRGSGWWCAQDSRRSEERREKNASTGIAWVDRVEVLEPRSDKGTGASQGGYRVHNIEVEGHPSYSVNGILVHNCKVGGTFVGLSNYVGLKNDRVILIADEASLMGRGFLDSVSNLRKNPVFKFVCMGNPKETTDALGIAAEPAAEAGGWSGYDPTPKTQVWKTRARNGWGIQLCGYDSPNYDYPRGLNPYPGLITPEQIENDLAYYGESSLQFSMMNLGIMPRDASSRRVITKLLCEQRMAFDAPVWSGETIRLASLDPAYKGIGGDRCVLTPLKMGKDTNGKWQLAFDGPQVMVPLDGGSRETSEDQIVRFCMEWCTSRGIAADHFALDATEAGTLVSSFCQIWSPSIVAITFGGAPPDRLIRSGDTKKENEAYGKMVSALWFASYYVIEAGQLRGAPVEAVDEAAMREWKVNNNQSARRKDPVIDVEPKKDMKKRMGRSPDLWDSFVAGLELARRLGFVIGSGNALRVNTRKPPDWAVRRSSKLTAVAHRQTLVYK